MRIGLALAFLKKWFSKAPTIGAIDIGSNTIKVAMVNAGKGGVSLYRLAIAPTPPMTIKDGSVVDSAVLGDAIKNLLDSADIEVSQLISSVSGQQVVIRPIRMIKLSPKELNQAIKWEAERYLPYSVTEAKISGTIITEDVGDGKNMEVLLIAVPNEMVKNSREVIKMAEVEPGPIDLEPFALYRALKYCLEPEQMEQTLAIINLGAAFSSINIFQGNILRHNRTISIAGNSFTKAIGQSLNLSFEEAEKIKKEKGVIRVENDATPVAPTTMRIFNLIIPVLTELVTEIQRSFDYYRSHKGESVDLVVLTGGTARFKNIDTYLFNELGIACETANPFKKLPADDVPGVTPDYLEEIGPIAMTAIGLALREVG